MWNIKPITGTLYTQHETTLGHMLQHIYWLENLYSYSDVLPYGFSNVKSLIRSMLIELGREGFDINCKTNPIENYCTILDQKSADFEKLSKEKVITSWCNVFDYLLHDIAVTATFKVAEDKKWARVACQLWIYSRQLRVSVV